MTQPVGETAVPGVADENLAFKTDNWKRFVNANPKAAADLLPRPGERHRSLWSFTQPDDSGLEALTALEPAAASLLLQAITLFISACDPAQALRTRVMGIRFARTAIPCESILDEPGVHVCEAFDHTHRHLAVADAQAAEAARAAITASSPEPKWEYSREEIAPLLHELLASGRLRPEHQVTARRILSETIDGREGQPPP